MAVSVNLEEQTNHALVRLCLGFVLRLCASVPHAPAAHFLVACLHCTKTSVSFLYSPKLSGSE